MIPRHLLLQQLSAEQAERTLWKICVKWWTLSTPSWRSPITFISIQCVLIKFQRLIVYWPDTSKVKLQDMGKPQNSKHCLQKNILQVPLLNHVHRPKVTSPVNSPHKGQWRGALMFSLICSWTSDWASNREAGDLRRHRTDYDVTVMWPWPWSFTNHSSSWFQLLYSSPCSHGNSIFETIRPYDSPWPRGYFHEQRSFK